MIINCFCSQLFCLYSHLFHTPDSDQQISSIHPILDVVFPWHWYVFHCRFPIHVRLGFSETMKDAVVLEEPNKAIKFTMTLISRQYGRTLFS